ncbi:hypothetical protein [Acinetobacter baumannii]|uniref:hypothetical protein n=1 Tax=Acinetobacter baumannii TaxID=470 RepID=UPI001A91228A|nr:hypothetical protein [Acinetobacter baumannii]MBO0650566.1 hypothetical protein [Acinetobacter baumannii]MCT9477875.1 hypothetical protein [Acinetobacter baumannii]MCZ3044592.1 hypothetical protein [Acinetobacter baumannii]HEN9559535.1 hypothetical protein [Acinetobacter baumannii]
MDMNERTYTKIANNLAKAHLQGLLDSKRAPRDYRMHMEELGKLLAESLVVNLKKSEKCLVISTAEDADFLQAGVKNVLESNGIQTKIAVFWNNHYQLPSQDSVAPIVHKFIEPGFEDSEDVIIVKSVMSGSCVVRTNLIAMLSQIKKAKRIFIVSPVIHKNSENSLCKEFPLDISSKFNFVYFAKDAQKDKQSGEVIPGIGGQVYELLGLEKQPVLTGYIPNVVQQLAF